jgi:pimeloyl-ACP methyl ester carboxylesterase
MDYTLHFIPFRNSKIRFATLGDKTNPAAVLLHGYLESLEIWNPFIPRLSDNFFMICMDLPGHGMSGKFAETHRMDELSEAVKAVADALDIERFHLAGHSMGGYIALACLENYPERLLSCTLFHSGPYADSEEKRLNRDLDIQSLQQGHLDALADAHLTKAFAAGNAVRLAKEINAVRDIALLSPPEGSIALLQGMKARPDRCELLRNTAKPILLIAGKKDTYIPFEVSREIAKLNPGIQLEVLENSGHMGFIEEPAMAAGILRDFWKE